MAAMRLRFGEYMSEFRNIAVRYNSATAQLSIGGGPKSNVSFVGNVAPHGQFGCAADSLTPYNIWNGAKCGSTDRNAVSGFVDEANFDYRLKRGSAAVNRGSPKSFPGRDIFGTRRPLGRLPDAGAVESR